MLRCSGFRYESGFGKTMNRFKAHPTPNPDSVKVTTTGPPFTDGAMESFRSAGEAAGHPLAHALLSIDGVANVFVVPAFLTVTKTPAANWDEIWPSVSDVLEREHPR